MNQLSDMVWVESRKALRSRIPFFTGLVALFMSLGVAFLIFISKDPELSRKLGLISAKADLMAGAASDWPTYLGLVAQMIALGGLFLFILIVSWVFGREFADGTLKDMLAVPVPRASILLAKFIVAALWSAALAALILITGLVLGAVIDLPGGSPSLLLQGAGLVAVTAGLVIAVVLPFALLAGVGRGYLLPLGMAFLTLVTANLVAVAGWGEYFPWAVPGLIAQGAKLAPVSYWIVVGTGILGVVGTVVWWKYADQSV
jgi:ABC-2 type transport system permease protein